jgi:hypothetical protein
MKKLIWLILLLPILLTGTKQKEQWHYELPFRAFDLNDSIPTINQFGQIRNGIIVDALVNACNADPSGVKLTPVELDYIRSLVGGMYVIGTWQKSIAVYGFVGGNAFKHKFNWKAPTGLQADFTLAELTSGTGTVTHSLNGAKGTLGVDLFNYGVYNSFVIPSTHLTNGNFGFSFYITIDDNNIDVSFGNSEFPNSIQGIARRNSSRIFLLTNNLNTTSQKNYSGIANQKGLHLAKISGTTVDYFFKGNKETQTSASTQGSGAITTPLYLMGRKQGGATAVGSSKTYGYFDIYNSAITDKQAIQQSQIVTYSQTILGRQ